MWDWYQNLFTIYIHQFISICFQPKASEACFPRNVLLKLILCALLHFSFFIIPDWLQNLFQVIKAVNFDAGTIK
jgi:hypothetical protein